MACYNALAIWRGILSVKESFMVHIRYPVGSGQNVPFWLDKWIGDRPLAL